MPKNSKLTIKDLYEKYPKVSSQTKTDIIGAIGYDIEGNSENEGGKFTKEQLVQGLRYLLIKNDKLNNYRETTTRIDRLAFYDPFYAPSSDWLLINLLILNSDYHHHDDCTTHAISTDCNGGDGETAIMVCCCVALSLAAAGFCICSGVNTMDTLNKEEEAKTTKIAKITLYLLASILPAAVLGYYLHDKPKNDFNFTSETAEKIAIFTLRYVVPIMVGAAVYALTSYIGKQITIEKKPSAELLAELSTIKRLLEMNYSRPGDDTNECREFIKAVVRYYIDEISKKNEIIETSQLLSSSSINTTIQYTQPSAPRLSSSSFTIHQQQQNVQNSKNKIEIITFKDSKQETDESDSEDNWHNTNKPL